MPETIVKVTIGGEEIELKPLKYAKYMQFTKKTSSLKFDKPETWDDSAKDILDAIALGTGKDAKWIADNLDGRETFIILKRLMEVNSFPLAKGQEEESATK